MPVSTRPRLLIFVIAYCAESTLKWVLDRIPSSLFDELECEILVVDDASSDATFNVGAEYMRANQHIPMRVLKNGHNQGYGGNQKVGYSYAIAQGFDFVALVHGDGQYAPEALPQLVAPLLRGEADAVFGSRMLEKRAALRGGMPLYKYVGNKILTTTQNTLLGSSLSEFHSGYRLYRVATLKKVPFDLNSNDFHFDTEIIIQLLNSKSHIQELPIPTYYGDEICRVNGMKYAGDVIWATLQNVAHRAGLRHQRRFAPAHKPNNSHYELKLGYASSHTYALDAVAPGSRVLDIGSGPGGLASQLLDKGCEVTVVDQFPSGVEHDSLKEVIQDLDAPPSFDVSSNEVLLLLDVIEHLKDPEQFLRQLREQFDYEPKKLVLTTPNIAFFVQRLMLLLGQFNYGPAGILDRTHTRLFTFATLSRLLKDEGFVLREVRGVPAPFPKVLGNGILGKTAVAVNQGLIALSKTLFSYQIYVEAESTPPVSFVLADTRRRSSPPPASDDSPDSSGNQ